MVMGQVSSAEHVSDELTDESAPQMIAVTPVWGRPFISLFGAVVLPSFLSQSNFPYLGRKLLFVLYTTKEDLELLNSYPSFKLLLAFVQVRIEYLEQNFEKPHVIMSQCEEAIAKEAALSDVPAIYLQPDAMLSDGAIKKMFDIWQEGYRVILVPGIRVEKETFLEKVRNYLDDDASVLTIEPRNLMRHTISSLHPISKSLLVDSKQLASHLSHLYWRVGESGLLGLCAHIHPILVHAESELVHFEGDTLDGGYVASACLDSDKYYIVSDTDDFAVVEISPSSKRLEPIVNRDFNVANYRKWVRNHCGVNHKLYLSHTFFFKADDVSPEWEPALKDVESIRGKVFAKYAGDKILDFVQGQLNKYKFKYVQKVLHKIIGGCRRATNILMHGLWFNPLGPQFAHPYWLAYRPIRHLIKEFLKSNNGKIHNVLVVSRCRRMFLPKVLNSLGGASIKPSLIDPDIWDLDAFDRFVAGRTREHGGDVPFDAIIAFDYGADNSENVDFAEKITSILQHDQALLVITADRAFDIFSENQAQSERMLISNQDLSVVSKKSLFFPDIKNSFLVEKFLGFRNYGFIMILVRAVGMLIFPAYVLSIILLKWRLSESDSSFTVWTLKKSNGK